MEDYNEYEKRAEAIIEENKKYLDIFLEDMKGLSKKTIDKHYYNVRFYLNEFLLYYDIHTFKEGINMIDEFLGDFFIRKCLWSSPSTIKSTATSIKKFYKSMLNHGFINQEEFNDLKDTIKDDMEYWIEECEGYGSNIY